MRIRLHQIVAAYWPCIMFAALSFVGCALAPSPACAADDPVTCLGSCLTGTCFDEACACGSQKDEEEKCSYGPCDCKPRGTLLQWSYGTSFSGGPPSMDEPLASDRPDFTEASVTVGRGVVQIEFGYTFTTDTSGGERTSEHSYPETLFRIGMLAEWLEFRIAYNHGSNDVALDGAPISSDVGAEDLYLGFKIALTPQEGILPETAIMPQMTVPSGSRVFTAEEVLPGVNYLYGWDINDWLSLGGSTQVNRARDDAANFYTEFAQSITVGYSLAEPVGAYTEWFVLVPNGVTTAQTEHYFNGGFTYLVTNNLQLDIRAGLGLNEAAADFFTGTGAVVRF